MKSALTYIRVSTKEQADSLPVQESKVRDFCTRAGLPIDRGFTDKQTARNADRPELKKLMKYCQQHRGKVGHVVVSDLSRLARNVADQAETIATLTRLGVELHSVDEQHLDQTAAGKLAANILGSFNQYFSDALSERTKFRMQAAVKAGRFVWVAPLGYLNPNKKGSLITVDAQRAPLIKKAFQLIASGDVAADAALRSVNALGLRTRKGGPVPRQTFNKIIRNELYAGWIVSGELRVQGQHDTIISEDLFKAVQDVLDGKARAPKPRSSQNEDFPLRGFIRCAKCDKKLTAGWARGKGKKLFGFYWCYRKGCCAVSIRKEVLEARWLNLLEIMEPTALLLEKLPELIASKWGTSRRARMSADQARLNVRLNEQQTLRHKLLGAKLTGDVTRDDFEHLRNGIAKETTAIESALSEIEEERKLLASMEEAQGRALLRPADKWRTSDLGDRQELQNLLFPDGIKWHPEWGFFEHSNAELWADVLTAYHEADPAESAAWTVGVPDGI